MEASVINRDGKMGGSQENNCHENHTNLKGKVGLIKKRDKIQTRRHDKVMSLLLLFFFYTIGEYILNSFVFVMVVM